jgi:hypothetical protein
MWGRGASFLEIGLVLRVKQIETHLLWVSACQAVHLLCDEGVLHLTSFYVLAFSLASLPKIKQQLPLCFVGEKEAQMT